MAHYYLACDLGAESGRLILGALEGGTLTVEELHRFPNIPLEEGSSLRWDIPKLFSELKEGLKKAAARGLPYSSISADSWGVDYLLFDKPGRLIEPTFHYRDPRATQGVQRVHSIIGRAAIFDETGIQFMPINTIYQLAAESPERLAAADFILGVGDGFNYLLSGFVKSEVSLASTFQLYSPRTNSWSEALINRIGFRRSLFPEIVPSGTIMGNLRQEICAETGLPKLEVIATCSHDTGAAVAAVPALEGNWGYISSGTWSLIGVETKQPVLTDLCQELNFTNEIGYGGSVRLLKNIIGLWLIQESRRHWAKENRDLSYARLVELAGESEPFRSLINPALPEFVSAGDIPIKIANFCRRTNQPIPETPGQVIRCALESLALLYRQGIQDLEKLTGRRLDRMHIVGGGSKNNLLNQFTSDAANIPVLAGPVEATSMGNLLIQAIAQGHLPSLEAAREVVRNSSDMQLFTPKNAGEWEGVWPRFQGLMAAK